MHCVRCTAGAHLLTDIYGLYMLAESYLRAYFAEEGIITEEQDKFVDIAKASQLIGACSIALALVSPGSRASRHTGVND